MPTEGAGSISELDKAAPTSAGPAGEIDDELRQLKDVLLASFSALDGAITNTGATGGAGDTDPPDAATFSNRFEDVRTLLAATSSVPIGAIMMWSGLEATIPAGWALCDGQNGTPSLIGQFILAGADAGNPAADKNVKTTVAVNADTGAVNQSVQTQSHTHYYLPKFYTLAYIQYTGV